MVCLYKAQSFLIPDCSTGDSNSASDCVLVSTVDACSKAVREIS